MSVVQFSYDGQIRKFLIQFIRMVSNFQVQFGQDANGTRTLQTVPVYYGDPSRQASTILKQNSENTLSSVPAMAAYISGLQYDRERIQNPYHESTMRFREQVYDPTEQSYTGTQDGIYTVDRIMPAPYKLTVKLDIWTSNTDQKHQILEQLTPLFNPSMEIQSNDNYIDWTSLSVVLLTDVNYTSRTVPMMGDDTSIDVATMTFELPIWITLPAKVKKMGVVAQIIANMHNSDGDLNPDIIYSQPSSQQRFTPMNYEIVYVGNTLTLYKDGVPTPWMDMVSLYGTLVNGISQMRLTFDYPDGEHEISGTVAYNPTDPTQLLFTAFPESLPANTLTAVDAIIDPYNVTVDSHILAPTVGTRYLILNPIGEVNSTSAVAWAGAAGTNLVANANDIITWNGQYWTVQFDSKRNPGIQYITNANTHVQYRWTGETWVKSYEGEYTAGNWSLVL
jgi:hypothetical protein